MSEITSKLAEIRERHEAVTGYFGEGGTAAHWDRDTLLRMAELLIGAQQYSDEARAALEAELEAAEKRIAELETDRDHQLRARKDLEGVIRKRNRRIAELEAELEANQQSWQEHDQGRIFAAKQMQLRIEELKAENKRLFAAHSAEMVRADKLKQELDRLRETISEFLDAKIIDELQLFFNVEVAAGGGQEICPRCNQEMGSPHYCRPDWSGPSIGDKEINNE